MKVIITKMTSDLHAEVIFIKVCGNRCGTQPIHQILLSKQCYRQMKALVTNMTSEIIFHQGQIKLRPLKRPPIPLERSALLGRYIHPFLDQKGGLAKAA